MKFIINRIKNRPLIVQIIFLFLLSIVLTIAFNAIASSRSDEKLYISKMEDESRSLARYTLKEMETVGNLDFLMPYWEAHFNELDIVYDDRKAIVDKERQFNYLNPRLDFYIMTEADINGLSNASKKLYAEIAFMKLVEDFDNLKRIYKPLYLYCVKPVSENENFYFVTGAAEGEKRGTTKDSIYTLGAISVINKEDYPVYFKTIEEKKEQLEMEVKDNGNYHVYVPILGKNDDVLGIIGVTLESNTVKKQIRDNILFNQSVSALIFLLGGILLIFVVSGMITKPLALVKDEIRDYMEHKNSITVVDRLKKYISENEIGNLSDAFSKMVIEIDRYTNEIETLATERERISAELNVAKTIQASYLPTIFPPFPDREEFDLYATMDPAKEVGGDFYDFFLIDDDHLGLVMADVSGKGVPAALFMMISKTLIKNHTQFSISPAEILTAVNAQLCENNDAEMFVTVWLGILEISTGKLTCANGGHEFPAIKKKNGQFELYKDKHGLVLGGMSGIKYKEYELMIEKGDILFVYTDGVPEATDSTPALFGTDRMLDALNQDVDANVNQLLVNVRASIDDFVKDAPQFDDITMMALHYKAKE